jgi:hypothetical protein
MVSRIERGGADEYRHAPRALDDRRHEGFFSYPI